MRDAESVAFGLRPSRAFRVGLTGGIGAGKSAVAERWRERGALVIDADRLAREAVAAGSSGLAAIAARWPSVIAADGTLDRSALAAIVFADAPARAQLEAIVHPRVRALRDELERAAVPGAIVVWMVPLLFETGADAECDATVVVIAPDEQRASRVVARDGVSAEGVRGRMAAQIDPVRARERADVVIDNAGDLVALRAQADAAWERIVAAAHAQRR